tara:strand:- start:2739 stop:2897 length:159 start_codon:yes stop_codon:yes gene_type:complete
MLEECGLPYYVARPVNIGIGEQFAPSFLKIAERPDASLCWSGFRQYAQKKIP